MQQQPNTKINIDEIHIPSAIRDSKPNPEKYNDKKTTYQRTGQIRPICISEKGNLTNGYITYLIYKELGITGEIDVYQGKRAPRVRPNKRKNKLPTYRNTPTLYLYGKFHPDGKEYVWRATDNLIDYLDCEGRKALVNAGGKKNTVHITRTEVLDHPPINKSIKKVVKVLRRKEEN